MEDNGSSAITTCKQQLEEVYENGDLQMHHESIVVMARSMSELDTVINIET